LWSAANATIRPSGSRRRRDYARSRGGRRAALSQRAALR